jgi:hypothetical protein
LEELDAFAKRTAWELAVREQSLGIHAPSIHHLVRLDIGFMRAGADGPWQFFVSDVARMPAADMYFSEPDEREWEELEAMRVSVYAGWLAKLSR